MLAIIHPTENDLLYDLGCGDGRICIAAAVTYGCRSVGIEIDPKRADLAREKVKAAGVEHLVAIRTGDANTIGWVESATIITMYLNPDPIKQLMRRTESAKVIASINHRLPGLTQTRFKTQESEIFIFRR
jgi:predicted RNA methylase